MTSTAKVVHTDHHDDFEGDHDAELAKKLPKGEEILWQGAPNWQSLAVQAFHVRAIAVYFVLYAFGRLMFGLQDGLGAAEIAGPLIALFIFAAAGIGILYFLAYLMARSTTYTITTARVIMHYAVALPRTINLPFSKIEGAAIKNHRAGTGDLPLELSDDGQRLGYVWLWPHARPWHFSRPQPMLRTLDEPHRVAAILSNALRDAVADQTNNNEQKAAGPAAITQSKPSDSAVYQPHPGAAVPAE